MSYIVSSGQVSSGIQLKQDQMHVLFGGLASDTTVNSNGSVFISSGGKAIVNTINASGVLNVFSGGLAQSNTINRGGSLCVSNGGTAEMTMVNSGGYLDILYGGAAKMTTVNSYGVLRVSSGGTAEMTTINSYGYLRVSSGGFAQSATVNSGGELYVSYGGSVQNTTVNSGGELYVSYGGTALEIIENGGYVSAYRDDVVTFQKHTFSGLTLSSCAATVHSGTTALQIAVNSNGYVYVFSGGSVQNTAVNSGGELYVSSGGSVQNATVNSGGELYVPYGGTALGVIENGGYVGIDDEVNVTFQKHTFSGLTVSGYSATVHSGTTALSTTLLNYGGNLCVYSGGFAQSTMIKNRGSMFVYSGGSVQNTTVNSSGSLCVSSGGFAQSTTVNLLGYLFVLSSATADTVAVNSSGLVYVSSGGEIRSASIDQGGVVYVDSQSVAKDTVVNSGGKLEVTAREGVLNGVTVRTGGNVAVTKGGVVSGHIQIEQAASFEVKEGVTIDFTAAEQSDPSVALINDWTRINGGDTAKYTLTVRSSELEPTTYLLAANAAKFNSTITVKNESGYVFGELKVGSSETWEKTTYTLSLDNGNLKLDTTPKGITIKVLDASKKYDGSALEVGDNYKVYGLKAGDQLTDVVFSGSQLHAGSVSVTVTSCKVMRGEVDVTDEYEFNPGIAGTLTVIQRNITVTSGDAERKWDGTPLTCYTVTETGDGFVGEEGLDYTFTGFQTDVGSSKNTFTYTAKEGTTLGDYNITKVEGTLTVTNAYVNLTITAKSIEKMYDGEALVLTDEDYELTGGTILAGDKLYVTISGAITDAGESVSTVTGYKVMRGTEDVTESDYKITTVDGTLTVTQRDVTLTSGDAGKAYDGTALTNDSITVSGSGFVEGQGVEYTVTGSQLDAGSSKNTFTYSAKAGTNLDNYLITKVEGTLEVSPAAEAITITADSSEKMYDGTALVDSGYSYTGKIMDGDELVVTVEGAQTDAGTGVNRVTGYKVMRGTQEVTGNYTFNASIDGTLTVTQRNVALRSGDGIKIYDGTPLTNTNVSVTGDGWAAGEGATCNVTGSQTEVGSSDNTFTYTAKEGTNLGNYNLSTEYGKLSVQDAKYFVVDNETVTLKDDAEVSYTEVKNGGNLIIAPNTDFYTAEMKLDGGTFTTNGSAKVSLFNITGKGSELAGKVMDTGVVTVAGSADLTLGKDFYDDLMAGGKFTAYGELFVVESDGNDLSQNDINKLAELNNVRKVTFLQDLIYLNKLTFTVGNVLDIAFGDAYGTRKNDSITLKDGAVITLGREENTMDFGAGSNSIVLGANAQFTLRSELANINSIQLKNGAVIALANVSAAIKSSLSLTAKNDTSVTLASFTGGAKSDKLTIGSNSSLTLGEAFFGAGSNAVSAGSGSHVTVTGAMDELSRLTLAKGNEYSMTTLETGNITATAKADTFNFGNNTQAVMGKVCFENGNDKLALGSDSSLALTAVDFGIGKDSFTVGIRSTVTVNGNIDGVSQLKLTAITAKQYWEGALTRFTAGNVTATTSSDTFTFGDHSSVALGNVDFYNGSDKLTVGSYSQFTAGAINFGSGNDTLTIGSESQVNISGAISFCSGKNTIKVGNYSTVVLKSGDAKYVSSFKIGSYCRAYLSRELCYKALPGVESRLYDIGTADVAVNFTSFEQERSDNYFTDAQELELSAAYDGWLCDTQSLDMQDYFMRGSARSVELTKSSADVFFLTQYDENGRVIGEEFQRFSGAVTFADETKVFKVSIAIDSEAASYQMKLLA